MTARDDSALLDLPAFARLDFPAKHGFTPCQRLVLSKHVD